VLAVSSDVSVVQARRIGDKLHEHARQCSKSPFVCPACMLNRAWFDRLPLPILALVLEDRPILKHR
jgi:hypothetical protein